jgi:hypothetical protein
VPKLTVLDSARAIEHAMKQSSPRPAAWHRRLELWVVTSKAMISALFTHCTTTEDEKASKIENFILKKMSLRPGLPDFLGATYQIGKI